MMGRMSTMSIIVPTALGTWHVFSVWFYYLWIGNLKKSILCSLNWWEKWKQKSLCLDSGKCRKYFSITKFGKVNYIIISGIQFFMTFIYLLGGRVQLGTPMTCYMCEDNGQFAGISSLLPVCGFQKLHSAHQPWWQAPSLGEWCHLPMASRNLHHNVLLLFPYFLITQWLFYSAR